MVKLIEKWWKHLINNNIPENRKSEVQEVTETAEIREINPEFEEKQVVEEFQQVSENYHGGQELTFSMDVQQHQQYENTSSEDQSSMEQEVQENSISEELNEQELEAHKSENLDSSEESEYGDDSDDEEGDYDHSGERELNVSVALRETPVTRKLRTLFQKFIERIAEVETKYEIPNGTQKLSVKRIMKRVLDRRSLKSCYVDTYKESVILLVDTSGSMDWWAGILQKITTIALERKDIEIYEAPNGLITRPIKNWQQLEEYYDWTDYEEFHKEFMRKTRNRVIIYIGDFDGGDTPYELATNGNKVYWICNENRYWDTADHDWCQHSLSEYPENCKILWAYDEEDLIKVFSWVPTEQIVEEVDEEW